MKIKNILVTGGAGFIGSHLCPLLHQNGYRVRILDNLSPQIHGEDPLPPDWIYQSKYEFLLGSITNQETLLRALEGIDAVVHLAAETGTGQSMYEVSRYNEVNSQGTALLLDIIANKQQIHIKHILLASSRSVYGEGAYICNNCNDGKRHYPDSRLPEKLKQHDWEYDCNYCGEKLTPTATKETDAIKPASIYAATKYAQEDLISISCKSLNINYTILRLQNVYGERQSLINPYTGILSIFSTRIRQGLNLPIFEDGMETRDFIHVKDVAHAFLAAINNEKPVNCAINVGTGEMTTVLDIAKSLSLAFNKKPDLTTTSQFRVGDIRHNFADIKLLNQLLSYTPKINLQKGLARFVDWVNTQPIPEDKLDKANQELKSKKLMG